MNIVYVTGNANKARYFSELVGLDIPHEAADTVEIQSLDLEEVVTAKAKEAYAQLKRPVVIEDTSLVINSLGRLPGPFIKWFLDEIACEGVCRLADLTPDRSARAAAFFAYFDGSRLKIFKGGQDGTLSTEPKGESGFGWNQIFIPKGHDKTLGEMDEEMFKSVYTKIKPFPELKKFLKGLM